MKIRSLGVILVLMVVLTGSSFAEDLPPSPKNGRNTATIISEENAAPLEPPYSYGSVRINEALEKMSFSCKVHEKPKKHNLERMTHIECAKNLH